MRRFHLFAKLLLLRQVGASETTIVVIDIRVTASALGSVLEIVEVASEHGSGNI